MVWEPAETPKFMQIGPDHARMPLRGRISFRTNQSIETADVYEDAGLISATLCISASNQGLTQFAENCFEEAESMKTADPSWA